MDKVLDLKYATNNILLAVLMLSCSLSLGQSGSRWAMEVGLQPQMTLLQKTEIIDSKPRVGLDMHVVPSLRLGDRIKLLFPLGYRSIRTDFKDYSVEFGCDENKKSSYEHIRQTDRAFHVGVGIRAAVLKQFYIQSSASIYHILSSDQEEFNTYACGEFVAPNGLTCDCYFEDAVGYPLIMSLGIGRETILSDRLTLLTSIVYSNFLSTYWIEYHYKNQEVNPHQVGISVSLQYQFGIR